MTVEGTAGEARDVLDRGNAPLQAVPTVPTTNARRESRVALVVALRGGTFAMLRLVDVCHQQKRNATRNSLRNRRRTGYAHQTVYRPIEAHACLAQS
jgi:hypothetical protein